ncbi:glutamate 5-kinase [Algiphilus sp. W345]|uniref:Glutamate 5-kinase n=1 Tax=Banduia mediterranea TaxID=3075609 RepID=A0ABU2WM03_9GAMM|nr:glutamate 5-kinase [Algiphilus sp. W345]MDT0498900.1 glutamate 5-kinase [Algiphilus sp. W345]
MSPRASLTQTRRWVVKVGSSLLTAKGRGLDREAIADWAAQIAALVARGHQVVMVSSGAVAEGRARLGLSKRPELLHELQAVAAVGQMGLVQAWEAAFQAHGLRTAQVLLTHDDVSHRARYLNARATLRTLVEWRVVPVVNENDTVATDEIRLGDNDTLGALVSNLIEAETLVILTDQDGLYTADPRQSADARLLSEADLSDPALTAMAGEGRGDLGRGGMRTKLLAAQWAARSGAATVIAHGRTERVLERIAAGESVGSLLRPVRGPMAARKRWIAGQLQVRGRLFVDEGAARVLREQGRSLLPVGVLSVEGGFERGDLVQCLDLQGQEVARGLVNYAAADAAQIVGTPSSALFERLGFLGEPEMIHRDNLVVVD